MTPSIPDKLYFKIGEVSQIVGVKPYVLRYWETEFKDIAPLKSRTNQRLYRRKDLEFILSIRDLLYKERFTINGARKRLKESGHGQRETTERSGVSQLGLGLGDGKGAALSKDVRHLLSELVKEMQHAVKD